jgi:hypothetical protein
MILFGWAIYSIINELSWSDEDKSAVPLLDTKSVLFCALGALLWVGISGLGGAGYQNTDLVRSNGFLSELIFRQWPPAALSVPHATLNPIIGDVGFFLPSAIVGKIWGWNAAQVSLLLYGFFGVVLALLWFVCLTNRNKILSLIFFVLAGGMDILGAAIYRNYVPSGTSYLESWAVYWNYSSNTAHLFWAPQQAIVGWILTGLIVEQGLLRRSPRNILFLCTLGMIWSPQIVLGLIPIVLAVLVANNFKAISLKAIAYTFVFGFVAYLFFESNSFRLSTGVIPNRFNIYLEWPKLLLFSLFEFGLTAML